MKGARGCVVGGPTVLNTGAPAKKQQKETEAQQAQQAQLPAQESQETQKPGSREVGKGLVHWPTATCHGRQTQCGIAGRGCKCRLQVQVQVQVSQEQASLALKRRGVAVSGERQSGRVAEGGRGLAEGPTSDSQ